MTRAVAIVAMTMISSFAASCEEDQLRLKDRTPKNLALYYGHLTLKNVKEVVRVQDSFAIPEDSIQGLMPDQGVVSLQLRIDSAEVPLVLHEADSLGFRPISTASGDTLLALRSFGKREGVYRYERGSVSDNMRIALIDPSDNLVWIYYSKITNKW